MTQALKHGLTIIPLLFELTPEGKAPWERGQWTAVFEKCAKAVEDSDHSAESLDAILESVTKLDTIRGTKKALGKLNSGKVRDLREYNSNIYQLLYRHT